jgi:hypothetical protein|nr:MAG TPA: hypothetical protein [Caudoviricetes sp.]
MKWNKLILRELTEEEQEEWGYERLWEGPIPNLYEEVLVTFPLSPGKFADTRIDTWKEIGDGLSFEDTENDVIYWMELPKYNGELDD